MNDPRFYHKITATLLPVLAGCGLAFTAHGQGFLLNGSFEAPTSLSPGNNFDTLTPTGWTYEGSFPYPRVGSGGFGYPAAADGTTIFAVEGERNGVLYQDLGTMHAGVTYTFQGTVMLAINQPSSYRVSFIGDPSGSDTELAHITDADFAPPSGGSIFATFSYGATAADEGHVLRLQLSDDDTTSPTRTALDGLSVTAVPEPGEYAAVAGVALVTFGAWRRARR